MTIDSKTYRVSPGEKVNLRKWPTIVEPYFKSDKQYHELIAQHTHDLNALQKVHFACDQHALLLIFQGMDAAGKDGAIRHVLSGVNPAGCEVFSFKQPSAEELKHDFLWRTTCRMPEKGRIGIFNRSYYEEVLVVRVHPEILRNEQIVGPARDPKDLWKHRYESIIDLEKHLQRNGTQTVKIFLHLSHGEQRRRFLARIDEKDKNWKFSTSDFVERKFWKEYTKAYEECLHATSTHHAPWFVVPADNKDNARLIISQIVIDSLKSLHNTYPRVSRSRHKELVAIAKQLKK